MLDERIMRYNHSNKTNAIALFDIFRRCFFKDPCDSKSRRERKTRRCSRGAGDPAVTSRSQTVRESTPRSIRLTQLVKLSRQRQPVRSIAVVVLSAPPMGWELWSVAPRLFVSLSLSPSFSSRSLSRERKFIAKVFGHNDRR